MLQEYSTVDILRVEVKLGRKALIGVGQGVRKTKFSVVKCHALDSVCERTVDDHAENREDYDPSPWIYERSGQ